MEVVFSPWLQLRCIFHHKPNKQNLMAPHQGKDFTPSTLGEGLDSCRAWDRRVRASIFPGPSLICRSLQWVEGTSEYNKYNQHIPTTPEERPLPLTAGFCRPIPMRVLPKQTPLRTLLWTTQAGFQYLWFTMDERLSSPQDNDFWTFSSSHFDQCWVLLGVLIYGVFMKRSKTFSSVLLYMQRAFPY